MVGLENDPELLHKKSNSSCMGCFCAEGRTSHKEFQGGILSGGSSNIFMLVCFFAVEKRGERRRPASSSHQTAVRMAPSATEVPPVQSPYHRRRVILLSVKDLVDMQRFSGAPALSILLCYCLITCHQETRKVQTHTHTHTHTHTCHGSNNQ